MKKQEKKRSILGTWQLNTSIFLDFFKNSNLKNRTTKKPMTKTSERTKYEFC